jgi:uncharacterized membrane protein YbhN (UPF0104 family)
MSAQTPEPSSRRVVVRNLVALVLVAGIFSYLGWILWSERETLRSVDWWAHPGLLVLHLALTVCTFAAMALGWIRIMRVCGGGLATSEYAWIWLTSNLGKYVPGKVFMVAARIELARKLGVRRAVSLSALVLEHVLHLAATGLFLLWALLRGFRLDTGTALPVLAAAVVPVVVLVVRPSLLVGSVNLVLRAVHRPELVAVPRARDTVAVLALFVLGWFAYGASGVALLRAVGLGDEISVVDGIAAFVAAWIIGFASLITPGGIGVREAALVVLLGPVVPTPQAIAVAVVARLSWTLVEMGGVVLGILIGRRSAPPE